MSDVHSYLSYMKYLSDHVSRSFSSIENVDINKNYNSQGLKLKTDEISQVVDDLTVKLEEMRAILSISESRGMKISKLGI